MSYKRLSAIFALSISLFASTANAELLLGVKGGIVDYDTSNSDSGINASFQIGYEIWDLGVADVALEAEISTSVTEGEIGGSDVSFDTRGIYASIRTAGPVYFIGRAGFAEAEIDNTDDNDSSVSVGVGFSTGLRWELELTQYEVQGIDIEYITLGVSF